MTAAFRSIGAQLAYAGRTDSSLGAPAGIVDGDRLILVLVAGTSSPPTVTFPSGFSAVTGSPSRVTVGGFSVDMHVAQKTAASESGSYNCTHDTASTSGFVIAVSGADGATKVGSFGVSNGSNGLTTTAPAVTTDAADALVLFLSHNFQLYSSPSAPSGTGVTFTADSALDNTMLVYAAHGTKAAAGSTGSVTQSDNDNAGSDDGWQAVLLAFESAAAGSVFNPMTGRGGTVAQPLAA